VQRWHQRYQRQRAAALAALTRSSGSAQLSARSRAQPARAPWRRHAAWHQQQQLAAAIGGENQQLAAIAQRAGQPAAWRHQRQQRKRSGVSASACGGRHQRQRQRQRISSGEQWQQPGGEASISEQLAGISGVSAATAAWRAAHQPGIRQRVAISVSAAGSRRSSITAWKSESESCRSATGSGQRGERQRRIGGVAGVAKSDQHQRQPAAWRQNQLAAKMAHRRRQPAYHRKPGEMAAAGQRSQPAVIMKRQLASAAEWRESVASSAASKAGSAMASGGSNINQPSAKAAARGAARNVSA